MKVLRIYDHLGELKKEFNVYVEGEDFKWQASVPEPVWLGTITLEEAGKEPEAEPTSEPEVVEPEPEVKVEEVKDEPKKVHRKRSRVQRVIPSSSSKSAEVVHQDDSPGDSNQGD